ncbi:hypothetical protein G210_5288 [Candida maltosa Xu316]|uniref:Uncharacterized protein n=1 Tax=Candida maltosa (strain Xu316) TaxID=1245528 RepID=M3JCF4_CANMX|nr:hypothetical protein G210_5288 [Candida maltosa Xu316]
MAPKVNKWKVGLISGAVIIGASYLILKTFPHIFSQQDDEEDEVVVERTEEQEEEPNSNKPIELFESEEAFEKK